MVEKCLEYIVGAIGLPMEPVVDEWRIQLEPVSAIREVELVIVGGCPTLEVGDRETGKTLEMPNEAAQTNLAIVDFDGFESSVDGAKVLEKNRIGSSRRVSAYFLGFRHCVGDCKRRRGKSRPNRTTASKM